MEDTIAFALQSLLVFPFLFLFFFCMFLGLAVFIDTLRMVVVVWNVDGFSDDFWNAKEKTSKWSNSNSDCAQTLMLWIGHGLCCSVTQTTAISLNQQIYMNHTVTIIFVPVLYLFHQIKLVNVKRRPRYGIRIFLFVGHLQLPVSHCIVAAREWNVCIFVLTAGSPQGQFIERKTESVSLSVWSRFKVFILQARLCRVLSSSCRKMTRKLRL